MKRIAKWILINGIYITCLILGTAYHVIPALNVFVFVMWLLTVLATITLFSNEHRIKLRSLGRAVPSYIDTTINVFIVVVLAASGMFLTAAAAAWYAVCMCGIYEGKD